MVFNLGTTFTGQEASILLTSNAVSLFDRKVDFI
jgi:hypothetical protein